MGAPFSPAVSVIAQDDDNDGDIVQASRSKLLLLHHEGAVAGDTNHPRIRQTEIDTKRSREGRADGAKLAGVNDRREGVYIAQQITRHPRSSQGLFPTQ